MINLCQSTQDTFIMSYIKDTLIMLYIIYSSDGVLPSDVRAWPYSSCFFLFKKGLDS